MGPALAVLMQFVPAFGIHQLRPEAVQAQLVLFHRCVDGEDFVLGNVEALGVVLRVALGNGALAGIGCVVSSSPCRPVPSGPRDRSSASRSGAASPSPSGVRPCPPGPSSNTPTGAGLRRGSTPPCAAAAATRRDSFGNTLPTPPRSRAISPLTLLPLVVHVLVVLSYLRVVLERGLPR